MLSDSLLCWTLLTLFWLIIWTLQKVVRVKVILLCKSLYSAYLFRCWLLASHWSLCLFPFIVRLKICLLHKVHPIDYYQTYTFMSFEKVAKRSDSQVKLIAIHTFENKQVLQNLFNECVLIVSYLSFSRRLSHTLPQLVLIVNLLDFFIKFTGAKTTLYINQHG